MSSWLYVMGPAIPSAGGPAVAVWKALSEASVFGPKTPCMEPGLSRPIPGKSTKYCCRDVCSNRTALPW